jgi:hypothetical protein
MPAINIEPLARALAERICRRTGMPESEIPAWVDRHWECAAADIEAGLVDEGGNYRSDARSHWERGLAAYRERIAGR